MKLNLQLFAGTFQLQLENSITAIKRLNDSLEYGVSLELISGPALSFHCRVVHHLLLKSNQNVIKALGLNVLQVLIGSLESLKKAINFNSIARDLTSSTFLQQVSLQGRPYGESGGHFYWK